MSLVMPTAGLSLDQAPPLSIPASFFLMIPLGILLAGSILLASGIASLTTPWAPQTISLAHAGTLGILAIGMMGALYQMTPVVAGRPVPLPRLAHLVLAFLVTGLGGFLWRLSGGPATAMTAGIVSLSIAFTVFILPVGWALLRPATKNETVRGMRLALISLVAVVVMGGLMARGHAGLAFFQYRGLWMQVHLTLALAGWVGGLIMSVSWQVVPMFYLAPQCGRKMMRLLFIMLASGLVLPVLTLIYAGAGAVGESEGMFTPVNWAALAALPAVIAVWLLHPLIILRDISRRKRKRRDASLLFWRTGLAFAVLLIPLALATLSLPDSRWPVLFGWLAIWGWAGLIMHGMLSRIVPFLVWFHRYSSLVGLEPVPSMRKLLSQRQIQVGFTLHSTSLALGVVAIVTQSDMAARATGVLLLATAISLCAMLIRVLRRRSRT
jgi:hypothetical protein